MGAALCLEMAIVVPRHNAALSLAEVRAAGGLGVDVALSTSRDAFDAAYGNASLRVCVNGTTTAGSLWVPAERLAPGRNWLHVELRGDAGHVERATAPVAVLVDEEEELPLGLTGVLPLAIDDAHRALVLLASLRECPTALSEILVIVPDAQLFALRELETDHPVPRRVVKESDLIGAVGPHWPKYALQMALKLLAARIVRTDFYLTLDADVVATTPLCGARVLARLLPRGRGAFSPEPRAVHPHWWDASAALLGLPQKWYSDATFGVTPAVLSTPGALAVLDLVASRFRDNNTECCWRGAWVESWGPSLWWSEYTLYRLGLDARGLFDALHAPRRLLCEAVWFPSQLPWNATAAFADPDCVFSLVQSTAAAPVAAVATRVHSEIVRSAAPVAAVATRVHSEIVRSAASS